MQTHCPHCETHFRITESQVDIADGYVRCGICEEVFNVYDLTKDNSLFDEQQQAVDTNNQPEAFDEDQFNSQSLDSDEENYVDVDIVADDEITVLDQIADSDDTQEKSDDFFDEKTNESLHYIIPDDIRDTPSHSSSNVATGLWSIGILLLIASLTTEYIWFNRDEFIQYPALQSGINTLCQQFGCTEQPQREPGKIKLITRNVYSHPNKKDALVINIVMKNKADFAQAYPVMQVDFSDIRGGRVAARRFFPTEYLTKQYENGDSKQANLLQPDTEASITLEIKDPGKEAMTYEFNFI